MFLYIRNLCLFFALTLIGSAAYADQKIEEPEMVIDENSFHCIRDMTAVRGFYVDNLNKDQLEATLEIANSETGGFYPPGSVVQLIPTEAMVKREKGFNAATKDWEFFELDVSSEGSSIRARGFVEVENKFGFNCFACHVQAKPEWDMICEQGHGCDPIPITRPMFVGLQKTDPRCSAVELTEEESAALETLAQMFPTPAE